MAIFRFSTFGLAVFLLTLGSCAPTASTPTDDRVAVAGNNEFSSQHLEVKTTGSGPDVILIPGLASNAAVWDSTVSAFEDNYTLHVVQVSGFGGAAARGNAGNTDVLDDLVADLSAYTQTLDQPPAIIGHSLGGLIALRLGLEPNATVDRLMVVDVLPFFSVLINEEATSDSMVAVSAVAKATMLAQTDEVFAERQEAALREYVKSDDGLAKALDWSLKSDRTVVAQAMSEVLVLDLRTRVAELAMPVSVIYARDATFPGMDKIEEWYRKLYAPVPGLNLKAVDDSRHFIMFDQEAAFLQHVETFLDADG